MRRLRVGTRGSRLALWQASFVARSLAALPFVGEAELVVVRTAGDRDRESPLRAIGGTGVFARELEEALLRGEIDLAVHSLKDLATAMPAGLVLAAVPERGAVEDCLAGPEPATLASLPAGAAVATGSPRRAALVRAARPDLRVVPIRGNVPTRLERVASGAAAVAVLARAGLERLGLGAQVREVLDPAAFPPAPGQGALGVQCRADDAETRDILRVLDHAETRAAVEAERAFLRALGSGCRLAAGALGTLSADGKRLRVRGFLADAAGKELHRGEAGGPSCGPDAVGEALAADLLGRASPSLRAELRDASPGAAGASGAAGSAGASGASGEEDGA